MRPKRRRLHEISSGEEEHGPDRDSCQEEDVEVSSMPSESDSEALVTRSSHSAAPRATGSGGKASRVHPEGPSQKTMLHYCGKQDRHDKQLDKRRTSGAFRPGGLQNPGRPGVARSINAAQGRIQQCNEWWDSKFRKLTRTSLPPAKAPRPPRTSKQARSSKCCFPWPQAAHSRHDVLVTPMLWPQLTAQFTLHSPPSPGSTHAAHHALCQEPLGPLAFGLQPPLSCSWCTVAHMSLRS